MKTPEISPREIQKMLSENRHPVLKNIRKQLTIEIIGWCIFLTCYYTMFDGDRKPVWINILLVFSILLPIIHNLMGYRFAKYLVQGSNIQESLKNYLAKVKRYAAISIISKQLFLIGLLLFFTYGLSFNTNKSISLVIIGLLFIIQLLLTFRIWAKRLAGLEKSINLLN
ncbi:hypothetical protein KUH03_41430 [Sphingobacterium sp. E70]|uniref:hypothetical protein n=1 Tax=Sphingobacterium sp. E70 TaxID=2853439 RepID=UPI00211B84FD|nr:hypothetical protein [Sphingobacterium sp. E70]ULT25214.1 hypothetical protein KUH03_41430 [Sphingobacterium sp. E70]